MSALPPKADIGFMLAGTDAGHCIEPNYIAHALFAI